MKKKKNINQYLGIALIIAAIVFLVLYFVPFKPAGPEGPEDAPLPKRAVQLTVLTVDCEDCFDITMASEFIKNFPTLNVTETTELDVNESLELAEKYNITKLPSILIKGDVSNLTVPNFASVEDALVLTTTPPPYYDLKDERVKGKVSLTVLEASDCDECFNMSLVVDQLKGFGIAITSTKILDYKSAAGKELVEKYSIEKVPTLLFDQEVLEYEMLATALDQVGSEEEDGTLVLRQVTPPYVNVATGAVEGLVKITFLVDKSCDGCYNVTIHKMILQQNFGMKFAEEKTEDVSSSKGKAYVKKYNIDLVPTVMLSKEASAYDALITAWDQVGTIEDDGTFVFRKIDLLSDIVYKNLTSGETINASVAPEPEEVETEDAEETEVEEETEEAETEEPDAAETEEELEEAETETEEVEEPTGNETEE